MSEKHCKTCRFFVQVDDENDGFCHRNSPWYATFGDDKRGDPFTEWPNVLHSDFCGDFQPFGTNHNYGPGDWIPECNCTYEQAIERAQVHASDFFAIGRKAGLTDEATAKIFGLTLPAKNSEETP